MYRSVGSLFIAAAAIGCSSASSSPPATSSPLEGAGGSSVGSSGGSPGGGFPTGTGGVYAPPPGSGGWAVQNGVGGSGALPPNIAGSGNVPGAGGVGAGGNPPFGMGGAIPPFGMGGTPPMGGAMNGGAPPIGGRAGASGGPAADGKPIIPPAPANCPTFRNGAVVNIPRASGTNVPVTIYMDANAKSKPDPGGPLIIYWHATLSNPGEVLSGFGQANIAAVTAAGGVVAAPATTACTGCTTTDDGYWYVEDDVVADTIVACAVQQAKIDVMHIHTLGWSAGGLHTTHVAQARSNYIASFISYSGGLFLLPSVDQNPANHVAGILTYGDPGADVVVLDFNAQSQSWYKTFQPKGWYSMMCHHPGGHEVDPQIAPLSLRFFKDHPFEVNPEPYASAVPTGYPSYCSNMVH